MSTSQMAAGIIPPEDALALDQAGVAAVYTPKDFELNRIMADVVRTIDIMCLFPITPHLARKITTLMEPLCLAATIHPP
jgi:hypothetical protein